MKAVLRSISINSCIIGNIYIGIGRNSSIGIYIGQGKFLIARYKFGFYLSIEEHYDLDDRGTFQPIIDKGQVPINILIANADNHSIIVINYLMSINKCCNEFIESMPQKYI